MRIIELLTEISGAAPHRHHPFANIDTRSASLLLLLLHSSFFAEGASTANKLIANSLAHRCNTAEDEEEHRSLYRFIQEWISTSAASVAAQSTYVLCETSEQTRLDVITGSLEQLQKLFQGDMSPLKNQAAILWHVVCIAQAQWQEHPGRPRFLTLRKLKRFAESDELEQCLMQFRIERDRIRHPKIKLCDDESSITALFDQAIQAINLPMLKKVYEIFMAYKHQAEEAAFIEANIHKNIFLQLADQLPEELAPEPATAEELLTLERQFAMLRARYEQAQKAFDSLPVDTDGCVVIANSPFNLKMVLPSDRLAINFSSVTIPCAGDSDAAASRDDTSHIRKQLNLWQKQIERYRKEIIATYFLCLVEYSSPFAGVLFEQHARTIIRSSSFFCKRIRQQDSSNPLINSDAYFIYIVLGYNLHSSIARMILEIMLHTQGKRVFKAISLLDIITYLAKSIMILDSNESRERIILATIEEVFYFAEQHDIKMENIILCSPLAEYLRNLPRRNKVSEKLLHLLFNKITDINVPWHLWSKVFFSPLAMLSIYCNNPQLVHLLTRLIIQHSSYDEKKAANDSYVEQLPALHLACELHCIVNAETEKLAYSTALPEMLVTLVQRGQFPANQQFQKKPAIMYLCEQFQVCYERRGADNIERCRKLLLRKLDVLLASAEVDITCLLPMPELHVTFSPFTLCCTYRCFEGMAAIFNAALRRGCYDKVIAPCIKKSPQGRTILVAPIKYEDKLTASISQLIVLIVSLDWNKLLMLSRLLPLQEAQLKGGGKSNDPRTLKQTIAKNKQALKIFKEQLGNINGILTNLGCKLKICLPASGAGAAKASAALQAHFPKPATAQRSSSVPESGHKATK